MLPIFARCQWLLSFQTKSFYNWRWVIRSESYFLEIWICVCNKKYYLNFKRNQWQPEYLIHWFALFLFLVPVTWYFLLYYLASSKGQTNLKQKKTSQFYFATTFHISMNKKKSNLQNNTLFLVTLIVIRQIFHYKSFAS